MTKSELVKALAPYDDDILVALYVNEDMNTALGVQLEKRGEKTLYCKADHVLYWKKDIDSILVITD